MIKQRPESRCWFAYYILDPIMDLCYSFGDLLSTLCIKMKGGWYCEYCHKIHCRRVYRYKMLFTANSGGAVTPRLTHEESGHWVCSLGKDAIVNEGWKPDYVSRGDKLQSTFSAIGDAFKRGMCDTYDTDTDYIKTEEDAK